MKIIKGDTVKVTTGKDKGLEGKVLLVLKKKGQVVVDGVNLYKRHQKGETKGKGEIVMINKPIDISNVKKVEVSSKKVKEDEKTSTKPTKKQSTKKASTK